MYGYTVKVELYRDYEYLAVSFSKTGAVNIVPTNTYMHFDWFDSELTVTDTGNNMDQNTVQFILLTICLPSVDSAISKVYEANPNVYNTMSTNEPQRLK